MITAYENFKPMLIEELKTVCNSVYGAKPKVMKNLPCVVVDIETRTASIVKKAPFTRDYYVKINIYASTTDECEELTSSVIEVMENIGFYLETTYQNDSDDIETRNYKSIFSARYDGYRFWQI